MKKYILTILFAASVLFVGCSTMQDLLYEEGVKTIQVQEDTVQTTSGKLMNVEAYESITGKTAPKESIIPAGETIELVSYSPKKGITQGVGLLEAFVPYGNLIGTGVLALLGIGGGALGTKVRKDKQLVSERMNYKGILTSVIGGVEEFSQTPEGQKVSKDLKRQINKFATLIGYDKETHESVKKITTSGSNE